MNILVTGADRGLGHGMVKLLLEQGHHVIAGEFHPAWSQLSPLLEQYPDKLMIVPMDVGSEDSVKAARKQVEQQYAVLDMLISNAGIHSLSQDMQTDYQKMLQMYDINAVGPVRVVEAFYDLMADSARKEILFVSSEAGSISGSERTGEYGYCMSKAALNMYGKNLYNRLCPEGYDIRLYYPGWIRSYMAGQLATEGELTIAEGAAFAVEYALQEPQEELHMIGFDGKQWMW